MLITGPMCLDDLYVVGRGGGVATTTCPVGVEEFATVLVHAFVGVRTEVVALRLQQVGGQTCGAVAIEVGERCADGGHWNAAWPHSVSIVLRETGLEPHRDKVLVLRERLFDLAKMKMLSSRQLTMALGVVDLEPAKISPQGNDHFKLLENSLDRDFYPGPYNDDWNRVIAEHAANRNDNENTEN